jgi:glycosidase
MIFTIGSNATLKNNPAFATFYFHVNKNARKKYTIDETLFSIKGRVVFANFNAAKILSEKMNSLRNLETGGEEGVSPSLINAMGLVDEILHYMFGLYKDKVEPELMRDILGYIQKKYGKNDLDKLLVTFAEEFPNNAVYQNKINAADYLNAQTEGIQNRELLIEELLVQWLQNQNKAYTPVKELIDDAPLRQSTIFEKAFNSLKTYFASQPQLPESKSSLLDMLMQPAQHHPDSVYDQLEFIKENWGADVGKFVSRILISQDFFKEEAKHFIPEMFGHETQIPSFSDNMYEFEPEAFSADLDWMPSLVLIAKSTYVWLDQLSKQYKRAITRLDQIPDEELNRLANFGFSGLWLIGLWERSIASKKIKQINGNPEAVASAYSLKNYNIAEDLGGFEAYQNLKERAWQRGIRLASDMVPNHMAIDSDWVRNHPHWFLQSAYPPFPNHTFNGPDLAENDAMEIYIEDGYWHKNDAAVCFKRVDKNTGKASYIYHGNDGTGMPWNDTAQLNFMLEEVREGVIQTILHVARMFPVIRFDAAMTLAKKHYQRLWFPEPGTGGDIPTRSEHAMTKAEFDRVFPEEFWREVVDRVQQECPDTLLLAEAFWMMESYFVRSLGMHRVYNSAFMHLLKNEENAKYRLMIQDILKFNPQILKRYVNFMNNPDEETAVAQFGKEDKYFGVCMLMCTMPGLPMFGHGQVEGYHEKYGMEYKKAYWDEAIDEHLVERHRREIFPVLKKRKFFSEVDDFRFYNFVVDNAHVNENVYVYSNFFDGQRVLTLYNNAYQNTAGWFKDSVDYKNESGEFKSDSLLHALRLNNGDSFFTIFREHISGLEYLRKNTELDEQGLFADLGGYKYQVFLDIEEVQSSAENPFDGLFKRLNGQGIASIKAGLHELKIEPITQALNTFYSVRDELTQLVLNNFSIQKRALAFKALDTAKNRVYKFAAIPEAKAASAPFDMPLENLHEIKNILKNKSIEKTVAAFLEKHFSLDGGRLQCLLDYFFTVHLNRFLFDSLELNEKIYFYDYWLIAQTINKSGHFSDDDLGMIRLLSFYKNLDLAFEEAESKTKWPQLFEIAEIQKFLQVNQFDKTIYFNKERWFYFVEYLAVYRIIKSFQFKTTQMDKAKLLTDIVKQVSVLKNAAEKSGFELEKIVINL